jgi:hypothetical protein
MGMLRSGTSANQQAITFEYRRITFDNFWIDRSAGIITIDLRGAAP